MGWVVNATPRLLYPRERPGPLYKGLVGPKCRSGEMREISAPPGFDLRTVQPVASSYTDWATRLTCLINTLRILKTYQLIRMTSKTLNYGTVPLSSQEIITCFKEPSYCRENFSLVNNIPSFYTNRNILYVNRSLLLDSIPKLWVHSLTRNPVLL